MYKSKIIKNIVIFSFLLIGLTGCEKWQEGQELEIDIESQEPVLTLVSFLESGKDSMYLDISHTQNINAIVSPSIINNVEGKLYKNNQLIHEWYSREVVDTISASYDILSQDSIYATTKSITYNTVLSEVISGMGDEYKIRIEADDFDPIEAITTSPRKPNIIDAQIEKKDAINDSRYDIEHTIKFTLDDPVNEENYYLVDGKIEYEQDGEIYISHFGFDDYDSDLFQYRTGGLTFKDETFDGEKRNFEFVQGYYNDDAIPVRYHMRVLSLSKDYFTFFESIDRSESANENPLAEPVSHYSNIEGGAGLFTIFTPTVFTLE